MVSKKLSIRNKMRSSVKIFFIACLLCVVALCFVRQANSSTKLLHNPGFEFFILGEDLPDFWEENPSYKADSIVVHHDSQQAHGGSVYISVKSGQTSAAIIGYGRLDLPNYRGRFSIARGHRYQLSAWLRGSASIKLVLYEYDSKLHFLRSKSSSVNLVTKEWQPYDIILAPDSDAVYGLFAIHIVGKVDIDDVDVMDLDGTHIPDSYQLDSRLLPKTSDWSGLNLGINSDVPPPWTSLSVVNNVASCWGREYEFDGTTPFPTSITTDNNSILTGPVELNIIVNGRQDKWVKDSINWTQTSGAVAKFSSTSHSQLSNIKLSADVDIEFDGMVKIDWTLSPSQATHIDSLTLNIPIKSEHAMYFRGHEEIQSQDDEGRWIAPALVTGYSGKSSYSYSSNGFMYQVWLGDDLRGLAWVTDSNQNWNISGSAVEITNEGSFVRLKLNIIDKTFTLTSPISFMMIFQATPVKPLPTGWDQWHLYTSGATPSQAASYGASIYSKYTTGTHYSTPATYPYPGTESKIATITNSKVKSHNAGIKFFLTTRTFCAGAETPAMKIYSADWRTKPRKYFLDDGTIIQYVCADANGWIDYHLYMARQIYRIIGNDGFYFDTSGALLCSNHTHGSGYQDDQQEWKPTLNILSLRNFYKRLYVLSLQEGKSPPMFHHHVAPLIPAVGFVDFTMDGESWIFKPNYDDLFANDCINFRLRFMEWQYGTVPLFYGVLGLPWRFSPPVAKTTEEEIMTLCLLHNMFPAAGVSVKELGKVWTVYDSFGIGQGEWLPFWNNEGLINAGGSNIKVSLYRKRKELLIIVANIGKQEYHGRISLNHRLLNWSMEQIKVVDALTNSIIAKGASGFKIDLKGRNYVLLRAFVR
ncbi:MAG: hypothetical protein JRD93_04360 [Deltaproteobacteria bacterium]|nr:hypothetical protein [Deltaproteobacteria bacterium]